MLGCSTVTSCTAPQPRRNEDWFRRCCDRDLFCCSVAPTASGAIRAWSQHAVSRCARGPAGALGVIDLGLLVVLDAASNRSSPSVPSLRGSLHQVLPSRGSSAFWTVASSGRHGIKRHRSPPACQGVPSPVTGVLTCAETLVVHAHGLLHRTLRNSGDRAHLVD